MSQIHHTPAATHRKAKPQAWHRSRQAGGFTLIELMIAVVIMGVLVAVALPSYLESIRKGRRAEAISALTVVQQAQERFRANSPTYGNLNAPADAQTITNLPAFALKHYKLGVADNSETGYTAVATAVGGQEADTVCALMGVRGKGGTLLYGSGKTSIDWTATEPDSGRCFAK